MFQYGSGALFMTPTGANAPVNPTPLQFGVLQDTTLEFSREMKEMYGKLSMPVAVAGGKTKLTGKSKAGKISGKFFNDLVTGSVLTTGSSNLSSVDEGPTSLSGSTTVTVAHSATFIDDLGVTFQSGGASLTKVASAPATGQYSVSAGVYTFASADSAQSVLISYAYSSSTVGNHATYVNPQMGNQPYFITQFATNYYGDGKQLLLKYLQCASSKLSFASKNDDFTYPDFEWTCFADPTGNVFRVDMSE